MVLFHSHRALGRLPDEPDDQGLKGQAQIQQYDWNVLELIRVHGHVNIGRKNRHAQRNQPPTSPLACGWQQHAQTTQKLEHTADFDQGFRVAELRWHDGRKEFQ